MIQFIHVCLEALAFATATGGVLVIVGKAWDVLTC